MKKILTSLFFLLPFVVLSQDFNMQNGNISLDCGTSPTFYDTGGGGAGQYSNDENFVLTICPSSPGERVQIDFTTFALQNNSDFMDIFDGDDTSAPLIGTYTGTTSPGIVVASGANPTGCLTVRFVSDAAGVHIGWQATVTCACQEIIANIDSTVPAFDASNIVNADVDETITFNGSGTFSSDGTGATYTWDFGDGSATVNGQTVTHDYTTAGVYIVTLTITDDEGCQNTNVADIRVIVGASTPGNPYVDAGDDVVLDCSSSGCTDITAEFLDIGETNTYNVDQIPFVPPFNFNGLTNSLNPNQDDRWSSVENLPFDFCFFTNTETQFQIGSNGLIRFDVDPGDTGNAFAFTQPLPNNSNPSLGEGNIFTPVHDIDPSVGDTEEIAWEIIGTAPNRVLAVSFYQVPLFQCNDLIATHMAVMYETTNVIDIYIKDKPTCTTWNSGNAAVGIQNDAGTTAFVPPGRNTSQWTTTDEAWRFTPSGDSVVDFAWLDSAGNIVGTTPTINVCPPATETYTARVIYTNCNGDTVTVTDEVTVEVLGDFTVDLGPDQNLCDTSTGDITLDGDIGSATATYQWSLDGDEIVGATNSTYVITGMVGGTYTVVVTDNGCDIGDSVVITYGAGPAVVQPADMVVCDDASNNGTETFDLTSQIAEILGTQDPTLFNVTFHPTQTDADGGTAALPNMFDNTTSPETIFVRVEEISSGCFSTTQFDVIVNALPVANVVADITVCDDDTNDGVAPFDFVALEALVLGTQDAGLFTVTFHPTQADADANTGALASPYTNVNPCEQIYVRIENNANTTCFDTTNFEICVDYQPTATQPADMVECDDASNDGISTFNFTTQIATIIGGQNAADVDVTFHPTQADADANTAALATTYTNIVPVETIFVRVSSTDATNTCYATTSFQIRVDPVPIANVVADITVCDDASNDGVATFDFSLLDDVVLGTQDGTVFTVTYFGSQVDADSGTNPLISPYTNTDPCEQIYVRIENNANSDCYDTTNFEICVNYQPTAVQPANMVVCDDTSNDGVDTFDFTTQIATIIGGQNAADVAVTFHPTQGDADANTAALPTTYTNTNPIETIFIRVSSTDVTNICYSTTSFEVRVNPLPIPVVPTTLQECDDDTDGFVGFTLTQASAEILAGQTSTDPMVISYYLTPAEAIAGGGTPLPDAYVNEMMDNQTVHIRIENTVTGCFNTSTLGLQVNPGIVATTPTNYSVCDDTNGNDTDRLGTFDLSTKDAEILGALAGTATVTYYTSDALAQAGLAGTEIVGLHTTTTPSLETVYARVTDNITGCFDVVELILIVDPLPDLDNIPPMIACDFNNSGDMMEMFDLTTHTAVVENGQVGLTITYHTSEADADGDVSAITNINGTDGQLIWVRAVNPLGCIQVGSFELQVPALPLFVVPTTLEACDDDTADGIAPTDLSIKNDEITASNPDLNVSYHLTQTDADGDVGALMMPYENTATPTTYTVFVRVEDINTGCHIVTQLTVNINDTPAVFPATDLEYCDTDNDGFGIFDIRSTESQITGGIIPGQVTVTYHETPEDADNNVSVLPDTYTNINAYNQTIYVRVENVLTGCFNVVPLNLIVHDAPEIAAMDATILAECDTDTDGIAQFDLTQSEVDILNGEDPLTHDVSYYNSQANAILGTGTGEINNVNAYSNIPPSPQIIWVRVEDLATGCFTVTNLTLVVNELPTLVQLPALELCDAVSLGDGIEVFDLTSLAEDLLNSAPGISLDYYANAADLASDTPIADPSMYSNVEIGVQTIFVRATNDTTGCQNTITFDIRVNPLPSPTLDPNGTLTADICDEDNDGFQLFDLNDLVNDIINNEPDVIYSFHETLENAQQNLFPLASPYTNIMMDSQTIYVLATNTVTGCTTITPLELTVTPIPVLPLVITDLEECDEATSLDGFDMFDLTQTQTEIYGTQTPGDFTLTYHESEQDAQDDISPIVNLTDYTNIVANQQTIWVRLEDNTTECFAIGSFDIIVVGPPVLVQPTPFALCDDAESGDESDEISSFDLTDKYTEITGGDTSLTLAYYANAADLASDTPIADPSAYQNTDNPQVIYIRATNSAGCTTDITMTLRVLPIPTPNTMPEPLTACDDDTDGILVFDLTLSEAEIVDNENNVTVSYHITAMDAMDDANAIVDPTMHTVDMATANTDGQVIIYVRVESDLQIDSNMLPCYKVVELPVIVHPLPALTDTAFTYVFCEYDNDNVGQFDWDVVTASLDLLSAPQDLTDFTVTYHPTVADALAGTAALVNGFENTTDPQTVFIRVENIATECVNTNNIASLELSVEPIPTATTPDTYELCADDQADQDTAVFDLTTLDTEIINGQTDMEVVYYASAIDADMDDNAITNANMYTNTSNPQTLYARVRQTITGCLSDPILVNLQVNPLPVFTLPADDILCVDATTGQALDIRTIGVDFGAGYTYQWTTPSGTATTATVQVTEAGTYSVTVTDMNHPTNCTFDDSVTYEASSAPSTLDIAVNTPAFADTHNVTATASGGSGSYEYQLDDGTWQTDGVFTDLQPGQHTITVRDTNGCGEIVRTFGLIDFMEFFTPNGDAYNATWNIIGLQNQPSAKIFIFDRYGKLLKQISPAGAGWDGTYNGNIMPSADYWFRVEYVDPFDGTPKEFINHFTLKR